MYGAFTYKVGVLYGTGGYGEDEMMCFRVWFERKILERSVKFFFCAELEILMTYVLVETHFFDSNDDGGNSSTHQDDFPEVEHIISFDTGDWSSQPVDGN